MPKSLCGEIATRRHGPHYFSILFLKQKKKPDSHGPLSLIYRVIKLSENY